MKLYCTGNSIIDLFEKENQINLNKNISNPIQSINENPHSLNIELMSRLITIDTNS